MDYTAINIIVAVSCAVLLLAYHLWLAYTVKHYPHTTVYGVNSHGRRNWVSAMIKGKKDILAVQSIRNLVMVSSILASTSIVLMFGFITFLNSVSKTTDANATFGLVIDGLFSGKVMVMSLVLCMSFFCFAQAMRFFSHVSMIINLDTPFLAAQEPLEEADEESASVSPSDDDAKLNRKRERARLVEESLNIEFVAEMLNRGSFYHTSGLRGYYFLFPILGYLFGPWALLGSTLVLIAMLRVVDFNLGGMLPKNARLLRYFKGGHDKKEDPVEVEPMREVVVVQNPARQYSPQEICDD
ncbi:hypothetical protein HDU98_001936 [Podochytrium sp. JEL0797]|nr:hypothetical protein HDU98_001936 [Podochytrium sp. JEL0797]